MLLRQGVRKALALGKTVFRRPLQVDGKLAVVSRLNDPWRGRLFNKDKKPEDEEEEDEEFRKKTFKEEFDNFWKDPRKKYGVIASLALLTTFMVTSKKLRDIWGLDLGFYKRLSLAVNLDNLGI